MQVFFARYPYQLSCILNLFKICSNHTDNLHIAMQTTPTPIEDLFILTPRVFADERGYFFESYSKEKLLALGLDYDFIQDNQSQSCYGTIRGLHFQQGEYSQAKLVRVLQGRVLDVAVDLRKNSATYGQLYAVELSDENKLQLLIPRGFAHGFSVLSESATFAYKCDNAYNKASEGGILFNDPALGIDWQIAAEDAILSEKDTVLPTLDQLKTCF